MQEFQNGVRLVEDLSELPNIKGSEIFLDFETGSGDPKKTSLHPWHNCFIVGVCITADSMSGAWYIPVGHQDERWNLDKDKVFQWLNDVLRRADMWTNHNVKYDVQCWLNDSGYDLPPNLKLFCTVTQAKIVDSDRFGYSLDKLSKDWLHEDINRYEQALQPYLHRNKDYSAIPADILGEYGGQDVLTNRRLKKYIDANTPEQCYNVRDVEIELTRNLVYMEREGLQVDPTQLKIKQIQTISRMLTIEEELGEIVGRSFRPHVNEDCFEVLCTQYNMPVLGWTDKGDPSFDKKALAAYSNYPYAPKDVVALIQAYRHLNTLHDFFIKPYLELNVDSILHPIFNQCVRTGRMSCSKPNFQQLSPAAKELIIPKPGCAILSIDYSQIEFRLICHYIRDEAAIKAYADDPFTDFHQWVADMIGISRKPAKTVNFAIGYGQGRGSTISALSVNMELVGSLGDHVDKLVEEGKVLPENKQQVFNKLCEAKGHKVFNTYHNTFPGLRRTSKKAERAALARGYVFNVAGRRRHIPTQRARIAFNTLNQSSAADIMKERANAVVRAIEGTGAKLAAIVHDEYVFNVPLGALETRQFVDDVVAVLQSPACELRVPMRCAAGFSTENWRKSNDSAKNWKIS